MLSGTIENIVEVLILHNVSVTKYIFIWPFILKLYFIWVKYFQKSIPLSMVLIVLQYNGNKFSPKQYRKLCRTSNHEHSSAILFIRPYIISYQLFDARDKRWQMNLSLSTNFLTTQTWVSFVNLSSSTACTNLLPSCLFIPMLEHFDCNNCHTISVGHLNAS